MIKFRWLVLIIVILIIYIKFNYITSFSCFTGDAIQYQGTYKGIQQNGRYVECEFNDGTVKTFYLRWFINRKAIIDFRLPLYETRKPEFTQEDYERVGWVRIKDPQ